ncbi:MULTISPECIES: ATP-binding protein [Pseudoalteromonas]|jgi:signal transduction histidine kinase|uniref:histidine kinase n=2 Tax=Pseudoalteromonas TaxID=53246 RepID=A0ABU8SN95_9GAMM|nr:MULTISPECIES: ATP-binding protein [unclassified Pseudoalteromonas]MED5514206.1 ATP-binding protein [Pseudomonadota bacterium]|tara:strand:- start:150 stop:1349 length:1200 start_codon:yes stop_codon:yes gene_type:complete
MYQPNYDELVQSWNKTLAVLALIAEVPVALVMKIENNIISVFSKNDNQANPYEIGDSEELEDSGLYCEHVIKTQNLLNIPNALIDDDWKENPDIKLNMISYLGLPICAGDTTPFGTICILDSKPHEYNEPIIKLLETIKQSFETQLKLLHQQKQAFEQQQFTELATLIRGIAHEINTPLGNCITTVDVTKLALNDTKSLLIKKQLSQQALQNTLDTLENTNELLDRNLTACAHKIRILQDLLYTKSQSSKTVITLAQLSESLQEHLKEQIKYRAIKLDINYQNPHSQFEVEIELLKQVLIILLQNSMEHAFNNIADPAIEINIFNFDEVLKIHYKDNGNGISSNELSSIFTPFFKGSSNQSGLGLGLSIAKKIVSQQLQGDICVQESDAGAHFLISLPK